MVEMAVAVLVAAVLVLTVNLTGQATRDAVDRSEADRATTAGIATEMALYDRTGQFSTDTGILEAAEPAWVWTTGPADTLREVSVAVGGAGQTVAVAAWVPAGVCVARAVDAPAGDHGTWGATRSTRWDSDGSDCTGTEALTRLP